MGRRRDFFHRVRKKQWADQTYKNPYLKERSTRNWKKIATYTMGFGFVVFLIGFFLYSPAISLQTVHISGSVFISSEQIEETVWVELRKKKALIIPSTHRWFVPEEKIYNALNSKFRFENIEVRKQKGMLFVDVTEKPSRFLWESMELVYVVDDKGTVLSLYTPPENAEGSGDSYSDLIRITDLQGSAITVGDTVLEELTALNIFNLLTEISKTQLKISKLQVDSQEIRFLRVDMEEGYSIYFDPTGNTAEQLDRAMSVLLNEGRDLTEYEYIDVRFGERVYVKDR